MTVGNFIQEELLLGSGHCCVCVEGLVLRAGMLLWILIVQTQLAMSHRLYVIVEQSSIESLIYQLLSDAFNILKYLLHLLLLSFLTS